MAQTGHREGRKGGVGMDRLEREGVEIRRERRIERERERDREREGWNEREREREREGRQSMVRSQ